MRICNIFTTQFIVCISSIAINQAYPTALGRSNIRRSTRMKQCRNMIPSMIVILIMEKNVEKLNWWEMVHFQTFFCDWRYGKSYSLRTQFYFLFAVAFRHPFVVPIKLVLFNEITGMKHVPWFNSWDFRMHIHKNKCLVYAFPFYSIFNAASLKEKLDEMELGITAHYASSVTSRLCRIQKKNLP